MKQTMDYAELTQAFMELTSENRDHVLAVVRALSFAQKGASLPPPDKEDEQRKEE